MSSQELTFPDLDTVLAHEEKARALRAQAMRDGFVALRRALSTRLWGRLVRPAHG